MDEILQVIAFDWVKQDDIVPLETKARGNDRLSITFVEIHSSERKYFLNVDNILCFKLIRHIHNKAEFR